jgi:hypothetical protein
MPNEADLKILIESSYRDSGTKQAGEAVSKLGTQTQQVSKGAAQAASSLQSVGKTEDSINKVGIRLAAIGAVMSGAILKGAKDYVSAVGMGSSVSRSWQASTLQLQEAYTKIGGVFATVLLPVMQKAADLADKIANFFQKYPDLAKLVVGTAGAATVGGTAIAVVQGAKTMTAIQAIAAAATAAAGGTVAGGAATAAAAGGAFGATTAGAAAAAAEGTAAGTAVAGGAGLAATIAGTVLGGLALGLAGNQFLSQTKSGKDAGTASSDKVLTVVAYELGLVAQKLGAPGTTALSWASNVGGATGAIPKQAAAAPASDMNTGNGFISTQLLQQTLQYQIQVQRADQDFKRQQFTATRDFNIQQEYAQEDYQLQVSRSTRDFYIQQEYAAQDYYLQASIASRDYYISVARSEQDYNISRTRAAEDHNFDLQQIMLSGDALQYYYSQREYNLSQSRADQDYQLQKTRAAQDFAKSQGDAALQFQISQARSQQQFQIQEADAAQNFQIQQKRSQDQFDIQMSDMDYNFQLERTRRAEDFKNEILPELGDEASTRLAIEQQLNNSYIKMLNQISANQNAAAKAPGKASGGYVSQGLYNLHSGEYVLDANTTQAAESVAKGNLTQDKIAQMLTGGGGGLVVNNNQTFARGMSADEKNDIRSDTRKLLIDAIS